MAGIQRRAALKTDRNCAGDGQIRCLTGDMGRLA
jgi:hypothetical protein